MYMSHYIMLFKYGNCTRLLKTKAENTIGCFYQWSWEDFFILLGVFNETILFHSNIIPIIPLALVGSAYEMIIANSALRTSLAIYHLISNAHSWNNC